MKRESIYTTHNGSAMSNALTKFPFLRRKLKVHMQETGNAGQFKEDDQQRERSRNGIRNTSSDRSENVSCDPYQTTHEPYRNIQQCMDESSGKVRQSKMQEVARIIAERARRKINEEEEDQDLELADRLLKVVEEHQTSAFNRNNSQHVHNHHYHNQEQNEDYCYGDRNVNLAARATDHTIHNARHGPATMQSNSSRKTTVNISSSTLSSPAKTKMIPADRSTRKNESFESDSSSDLFEIESTLPGFGTGLKRHDLPVYETKHQPVLEDEWQSWQRRS